MHPIKRLDTPEMVHDAAQAVFEHGRINREDYKISMPIFRYHEPVESLGTLCILFRPGQVVF